MKASVFLTVVPAIVFVQEGAHSQCHWTVQRGPHGDIPTCIVFVDSVHGWAGKLPLYRDPLLRTTDGGKRWDIVNLPYNTGAFSSLSFINTHVGWSVDNPLGRLLRTTDGGLSWTILREYQTPSFGIIRFVDSLRGWAAGMDSVYPRTAMRRTTDGGLTWVYQPIKSTVYYRMQFVDSLYGWAVGEALYATTDGGVSWVEQTYDQARVSTLYGVDFINRLEGWCCSKLNGWIIHTTNGGQTWENQALIQPPNQFTMNAVSFTDSLNGWAFGSTFYQGDARGLIYRTTDGGTTWYQESLDLCSRLSDGTAVDECHAWGISFGDGCILGLERVTGVRDLTLSAPETLDLGQNYPNPFNPQTTITFWVKKRGRVLLNVFDALGKQVATLVDGVQEEGEHQIRVDAGGLPSGTYFYQLSTPTSHVARRMTILR